MKTYKRLDEEAKRDWINSVANFAIAFISIIGILYILFNDDWYLNHPKMHKKH